MRKRCVDVRERCHIVDLDASSAVSVLSVDVGMYAIPDLGATTASARSLPSPAWATARWQVQVLAANAAADGDPESSFAAAPENNTIEI